MLSTKVCCEMSFNYICWNLNLHLCEYIFKLKTEERFGWTATTKILRWLNLYTWLRLSRPQLQLLTAQKTVWFKQQMLGRTHTWRESTCWKQEKLVKQDLLGRGEGHKNMMKAKEEKLCRKLCVQLVASCLWWVANCQVKLKRQGGSKPMF